MTAPVPVVELRIGPEGERTLARAAGFAGRGLRGVRRGMLRAMALAERHAVRNASGGVLTPRSTMLARHITGFTRETPGGVDGVLAVRQGLADKYAATQEFGTVGAGGLLEDVRPVAAKALAVPLSAAKDGRGVPIYDGPRDPAVAGSLFLIDRGGRPPLLARAGEGGRESVEPLFVLLPKVAIKPKRYLRSALLDDAGEPRTDLVRELERGINEEIVDERGAP